MERNAFDFPRHSPRYLLTDKGSQFFDSKNNKPSVALRAWLDRCRVKPDFGAVGKKGSIPVIERFFGTLKREGIRRILVPYDAFASLGDARFALWTKTLYRLKPRRRETHRADAYDA